VISSLGGVFEAVPLRRLLQKLERPVRDDDGVVTSFRDGQVTLRSLRREDGFTMSDQESGYQGVMPGDIVIHGLDAFAGSIGVSDSRGKCSPVYHVCRPEAGADPRFVAYALQAEADSGYLALQAGNVRQRAVDFRNWQTLARIDIPLPDSAQQRRIADYLDLHLALIDRVVRQRRNARSIVAERLSSSLHAQVFDAEGAHRPVSALAEYVNGQPFKPDDFTPSGLPVIRIRQLVDPDAEPDLFDGAVPDRVLLRNGDLIFSWSASLEVRIWDRGPAILNQHLFKVLPHDGVNRDWLRWALHVARADFAELMHGSTMTHVTRPMMREVTVPVPDEAIQRRIAREANRLDMQLSAVLGSMDAQLSLLSERRRSLLAGAVCGRIEIQGSAA
jgi:type I restriction enzyme S subunit